MKSRIILFALALVLICTACGGEKAQDSSITSSTPFAENQSSQENLPDITAPDENPIDLTHVTIDQFPIPTADTFGLSGEDAALYNAAVSLYSNRAMESAFEEEPSPVTHLFLPALTLYDKYNQEDGNTVYVASFHKRVYYELGMGLQDLNNPIYNYGSEGSLAAFTLDNEGNLVAFDETKDGEGNDAVTRVCGELTDLADFLCERTKNYPIEPRQIPLADRDEMVKQYLNYYFAN